MNKNSRYFNCRYDFLHSAHFRICQELGLTILVEVGFKPSTLQSFEYATLAIEHRLYAKNRFGQRWWSSGQRACLLFRRNEFESL